jgi:hypothetical protein
VRCFLAFAIASAACLGVPGAGEAPQTGITAAPQIARAYDLILDADFDQLDSTLPSVCPPAPTVACQGLEALGLWWRIQLDPDNRSLDAAFLSAANTAIAEAERFAAAEPNRAEAWFYVGAAYGVRAQFRVYRVERLAAARDGKQIKEALEKALALDPAMHDAEFGHRHVSLLRRRGAGDLQVPALPAPASRRGSRGRIGAARTRQSAGAAGPRRSPVPDPRACTSGTSTSRRRHSPSSAGLQQRYPHNPLFHQIEAEILDVYFHDHAASLKASERLLALAASRSVFQRRHRGEGRAPQHHEAVDRTEGAERQTRLARTRVGLQKLQQRADTCS